MRDTSSKNKARRYIKSSSFVMALLFTVLCGLAAISLGYFINYFATGHLVQGTEAVLEAETRYIRAVGPERAVKTGRFYRFLNADGSLPGDIPSDISRLAEGILVFDDTKTGTRYAARIYTLPDNRKLLIGTDITAVSKDFKFMQMLGVVSIGFVMAVVFVAYLISVFVVSGTNKIADTAREIMDTGDLSRRVDVGSRWDDLSNMAAVLNMLLARVETLMQGVRQVSDNIAHDLRTPLTRLRSTIEALTDGPQKNKLLGEADHLLGTFNALLRISRIEAEKQRSQFAPLNFTALLEDVIAFYEPLAEDKTITLLTDFEPVDAAGDRDLLFQAYANLIDNALKFTPERGQVHIKLYQDGDQVCVEIADTGPGVPEEDKDRIFERFYRAEPERSSAGTGLGLSLVSAVIGLHGGQIHVENTNPGLRIITRL